MSIRFTIEEMVEWIRKYDQRTLYSLEYRTGYADACNTMLRLIGDGHAYIHKRKPYSEHAEHRRAYMRLWRQRRKANLREQNAASEQPEGAEPAPARTE